MPSSSDSSALPATAPSVSIRPLQESDLANADRIMRLAFGTFIGLPDPMKFMGDADYVTTRWKADPRSAWAADVDGELAGSCFATRWGSLGFFGPLTVRPDLWTKGVASRLLAPVMSIFEQWGVRRRGLFTFPHSTKHVHLYQKFGFWPRSLTALMSAPVPAGANENLPQFTTFSQLSESEKESQLKACASLTDAILEGLEVGHEIQQVDRQRLGQTVLLRDGSQLTGFAVCHCGAKTEAGSGICYIKFAATRPGTNANEHFVQLLQACAATAAKEGAQKLKAGMNTARHEAYRIMLAKGFRADAMGVVMHSPNEPGYNRQGVFLIDDWR